MDHSNNIPATEEEDELYNVVESLLSKAISGTEAPSEITDRSLMSNSVHHQMVNIEDDMNDIDEMLYDDNDTDTMQMGGMTEFQGGNILDSISNVGKGVANTASNVGKGVANTASNVGKGVANTASVSGNMFNQIIGTGFVAFEGLLPPGMKLENVSSEQTLLHTKVIVFFVFRMIFELFIAYLFYTLVSAALEDNFFENKLMIYVVMFVFIGYKLLGPIFDKFIGHEVYSCCYITILIILCLLYLASNLIVRIVGNIIIICLLILFLVTFVLPPNTVPNCFNFVTVLPQYIDFKYYTKDTLTGILAFIGCDKICLILQLIFMSYIYKYRNPEKFSDDLNTIQNKVTPSSLSNDNTNSNTNNDTQDNKDDNKSTTGGKNKKNKKK